MKITISERFQFINLFPEKSSILVQLTVRDIKNKIKLSDKEKLAINFKLKEKVATWDAKKADELEINFTDTEKKFLKDRVKQLDKENKITQALLSLCLKIKEVR